MIIAVDNILSKPQLEAIRQSAIQSGYATWTPPCSLVGDMKYTGMNFVGHQAPLFKALSQVMGGPIFPGQSFFRILTKDSEKRYIHSDRNMGSFTCIVYLSDHKEISGTEFYRHIPTGRTEMPSLQDMTDAGEIESMSKDMTEGADDIWERTDFIRGSLGRMLIFSAPLFHARFPVDGIGESAEDARTIWVTHFEVS